MTSKETIKEFEHLLKAEKDRIHKDVVFITALENAIEALEKQIPKKIKTVYLETVCPYCRKIFYVGDPNTVMIYNFCPDCGQALDWSDENE